MRLRRFDDKKSLTGAISWQYVWLFYDHREPDDREYKLLQAKITVFHANKKEIDHLTIFMLSTSRYDLKAQIG